MIVTEGFTKDKEGMYQLYPDYNMPASFNKFLTNSINKDKQAYFTLKGANHVNQCDLPVLSPLELYLMEIHKMPSL